MGALVNFFKFLLRPRAQMRSAAMLPPAQNSSSLTRHYQLRVKTRWLLEDIETAQMLADSGQIKTAAQLSESMKLDGLISGIFQTRTRGLVILPKKFSAKNRLGAKTGSTLLSRLETDFEKLCPVGELAALQGDADMLGVGLGELVDRSGELRLVRLPPEFLTYDLSERVWKYNNERITPGDGRWVLHTSTEVSPWRTGAWNALARAFIAKDHAYFLRENYSHKLANPARVAEIPSGASDRDAQTWFEQVAQWAIDTVFATRPGYNVKLIESNGQGYQVFDATMKQADQDIMIALAGQTVTVQGGAGFSNSSIHEAIRADIIQFSADALSRTLREQVLPWWQQKEAESVEERLLDLDVRWDTTPPSEDRKKLEVMQFAAQVVSSLRELSISSIDEVSILKEAGVEMSEAPKHVSIFGVVQKSEVYS